MRQAMLGVLVVLLTACGAAGSPPDTAGYWYLWLPDQEVDVPNDDMFLYHKMNFDALFLAALGQLPTEAVEEYIRPSLTMFLTVVGGESPGITDMDVLLNCGAISQYEHLTFDPPFGNSDGTVEADLGFVVWEGKFTGSEKVSGTWTSGDCDGSWNASNSGSGEEVYEDGGRFVITADE